MKQLSFAAVSAMLVSLLVALPMERASAETVVDFADEQQLLNPILPIAPCEKEKQAVIDASNALDKASDEETNGTEKYIALIESEIETRNAIQKLQDDTKVDHSKEIAELEKKMTDLQKQIKEQMAKNTELQKAYMDARIAFRAAVAAYDKCKSRNVAVAIETNTITDSSSDFAQ